MRVATARWNRCASAYPSCGWLERQRRVTPDPIERALVAPPEVRSRTSQAAVTASTAINVAVARTRRIFADRIAGSPGLVPPPLTRTGFDAGGYSDHCGGRRRISAVSRSVAAKRLPRNASDIAKAPQLRVAPQRRNVTRPVEPLSEHEAISFLPEES